MASLRELEEFSRKVDEIIREGTRRRIAERLAFEEADPSFLEPDLPVRTFGRRRGAGELGLGLVATTLAPAREALREAGETFGREISGGVSQLFGETPSGVSELIGRRLPAPIEVPIRTVEGLTRVALSPFAAAGRGVAQGLVTPIETLVGGETPATELAKQVGETAGFVGVPSLLARLRAGAVSAPERAAARRALEAERVPELVRVFEAPASRPTRIFEAPPIGGQLRGERGQFERLGASRIIMTPAERDLVTGRIRRGPRPKVPDVERAPEITFRDPRLIFRRAPKAPEGPAPPGGAGGLDISKIIGAAKIPVDERAILPPRVVQAVNEASGTASATSPSYLFHVFPEGGRVSALLKKARTGITATKATLGLSSMADMSKGIKPFEKLVDAAFKAEQRIEFLQERLVDELAGIHREFGERVFVNALRIRDELNIRIKRGAAGEKIRPARIASDLGIEFDPRVLNPALARIGKATDEWADLLGIERNSPLFEPSYIPRQRIRVEQATIVEVPAYVSENLRAIIPSRTRQFFLNPRRVNRPADVYDLDTMVAHAKAVARASVMGTDVRPGFLQEIRPLLAELGSEPFVVRRAVANYINKFIGAPGTMSDEFARQAAAFVKNAQFIRTIGANLTSPLWNLFQRALIFAEAGVRHTLGGIRDEIAVTLLRDPSKIALLERAEIPLGRVGLMKADVGDVSRLQGILGQAQRGLATLRDLVGAGFRFSERGNRLNAFFAGYRRAIARGASEAEAIDAGRQLLRRTQFTYGLAERPPLLRGEFGSTVGQFKTFQIRYAEYVKDNFTNMFRPELNAKERLEAVAKFTRFWAAQSALGGASTLPFLGSWLEDHSPVQWRGVGALLGITLSEQLGLELISFKDARSIAYFLPGPAFSNLQDAMSAITGLDFGQGADVEAFSNALFQTFGGGPGRARTLSTEERVRRATRSVPAGIQLNRIRTALKAAIAEDLREGRTVGEALGVTPATGALIARGRDLSVARRAIGFVSPDEQQEFEERDIRDRAQRIRSEAIAEANRLRAEGRSGAWVLRRAERQVEDLSGMPRGSLAGTFKVTPQAERARLERQALTPIERRRLRQGRQLRGLTEEEVESPESLLRRELGEEGVLRRRFQR